MLPAICDVYRLYIGLVDALASVAFAVIGIYLGIGKKSRVLWAFFILSGLLTILAGPLASAMPSKPCLPAKIIALECNPATDDLAGEYVDIQNQSTTTTPFEGWTLCDLGNKHCFTFPETNLPPNATIRIWSQKGSNSEIEIFWGNSQPIWNNDGDIAILRDPDGSLIDERSCP